MPRAIQSGRQNRFTLAQREERLPLVAERILQGVRYTAIAEELGLSVSQVKHDAQRLRERWRDRAIEAVSEIVSKELDKLDLLEREAWASWEASKVATDTKPEGVGVPAFLTTILSIMERRSKFLGLDRPPQMADEMTAPENIVVAIINNPQLREHEKRIWESLAAAGEVQPGSAGDGSDSQ